MASGIGQRRAAAQADGGAAYQERRREIVNAAAEVFRDKGLRGTSLNDVAERLSTDRASLYYYVGSKDELFHEVVHEAAEANVRAAEEIVAGDAPAPEKLRALVKSTMASYGRHFPFLFVYIQENLSQVPNPKTEWSKKAKTINKRYDAAIVAMIQQGLDEGSIMPVASARVLAYGIIGMMNWTHRWFKHDDALSAEEIGESYAQMVLGGLATRRPRRR